MTDFWTLRALRDELTEVVTGLGYRAFAFVPSSYAPPAAVIEWGEPYVEVGKAFGRHNVRYRLTLVTAKATNEADTNALDDVLLDAVETLRDAGWHLSKIDQPKDFRIGNADYLGAVLHVHTGDVLLRRS